MLSGGEVQDRSRSSRLRRFALGSAVASLAALVVGFGVLRPAPQGIRPGAPAPEFDLPLLRGEGSVSSDDLEGKIVVLNFWWSGCYSCKEEAPVLDAAWREHRDEGVVVLGVDRQKDSPEAARRFADAFGMSYPIVRDTEGELARAYGVGEAFPQTFYIDRQWRIASLYSGKVLRDPSGTTVLGPVTAAALEEQLEALLQEG